MGSENTEKIQKLELENTLLREILDHIHEGVWVADEEGRIILYNREIEDYEGLKRENVIGKNEQEAYPASVGSNFQDDFIDPIFRNGEAIKEQHHRFLQPDGKEINIIFNSYPFIHQGKVEAVFTIEREVKHIGEFISSTLEMQKKVFLEETSMIYKNAAMYFLDDIVGGSLMQESITMARKIAHRNSPVLLTGETGTGKELFAHGIHNASQYAKGPFIPVNCAAIPETLLEGLLFGTVKGAFTGANDVPGLFEQAEDGTIFLDELNSMSLSLQAKLLRVVEDKIVRRIGGKEQRPVHCRIISAMNLDPVVAIQEEKIRSDLFYRLATVTIPVVPLRNRLEDVPLLCEHFIKKYNSRFSLSVRKVSDNLLNIFSNYPWPGNIRELENTIESAMNFIDNTETTIDIRHLPSNLLERFESLSAHNSLPMRKTGLLKNILQEVERRVIEDVLQKNSGNVSQSAEELGVLRQALHYRIRKFGIKART